MLEWKPITLLAILFALAACQPPQPAPMALSLNLICLPGTYQDHPAMGCQGEATPRDGVK